MFKSRNITAFPPGTEGKR